MKKCHFGESVPPPSTIVPRTVIFIDILHNFFFVFLHNCFLFSLFCLFVYFCTTVVFSLLLIFCIIFCCFFCTTAVFPWWYIKRNVSSDFRYNNKVTNHGWACNISIFSNFCIFQLIKICSWHLRRPSFPSLVSGPGKYCIGGTMAVNTGISWWYFWDKF